VGRKSGEGSKKKKKDPLRGRPGIAECNSKKGGTLVTFLPIPERENERSEI